MSSSQISAQSLDTLLSEGRVKILDGSWALNGTDMRSAFQQAHIPTAQFFDLETVCDLSVDLPHMAPSSQQFADAVGQLGISQEDHVVIYDQQGLFSSARIWWTFKLMGHGKVQILAGGLPAWQMSSLPLTDVIETPVSRTYRPSFQSDWVIKIDDLKSNNDYMIFDARSRARFHATVPEPRAGLTGGHIPQSHSLPYDNLLANGQLKAADELKPLFDHLGLTLHQTAVTTCGSGVTAAIIALALHEIGHKHIRLYDGSWAEWGQPHLNMPIDV